MLKRKLVVVPLVALTLFSCANNQKVEDPPIIKKEWDTENYNWYKIDYRYLSGHKDYNYKSDLTYGYVFAKFDIESTRLVIKKAHLYHEFKKNGLEQEINDSFAGGFKKCKTILDDNGFYLEMEGINGRFKKINTKIGNRNLKELALYTKLLFIFETKMFFESVTDNDNEIYYRVDIKNTEKGKDVNIRNYLINPNKGIFFGSAKYGDEKLHYEEKLEMTKVINVIEIKNPLSNNEIVVSNVFNEEQDMSAFCYLSSVYDTAFSKTKDYQWRE